ncbi:MAG: alpha/beta fold hydrolase [Bacillaceae bacterium]|nr:alpha/beta fold hydrolase [Bacillaceae bacterium]
MTTGCVLIHGFTGSPYEVEPLASHFKRKGWQIYTPTLAGHGRDSRRINQVNWQDWIESARTDVEEAVAQCDTVYLVGFSMGGLIASHLAVQYPIEKLVLLNAAVFYFNPRQMLRNVTGMIRESLQSQHKDPTWKRYRSKMKSTPIQAVFQFQQLVRKLRPDIARLTLPVLIVQGENDDLVHPRSPWYIYHKIRSKHKEIHLFPESRHIICHDCEQDRLIELVDAFLGKEMSGIPGS